jgi:hypothetical protein
MSGALVGNVLLAESHRCLNHSVSAVRRQYSPGRIIGIARIVCISRRSRSMLISIAPGKIEFLNELSP